MSVCGPSKFTLPGSCTGVACCQSGIPAAVDYFEPYLLDIPKEQTDPIFYSNSTTCRYVFLVETEWLSTGYTGENFNRTDDFAVPVVLDWAVRNVDNCSAARRNATDFACRSARSECFDADIIAAFDAAIHDGVDVLSVSLGGAPTEYFRDGVAIGSFHAVRNGVTVVSSAGNSGPGAGSVSNTAPWLVSVGASTMDREFPSYVVFNGTKIKARLFPGYLTVIVIFMSGR